MSVVRSKVQLSFTGFTVCGKDWQRLGAVYVHSARAYILVDDMMDSSLIEINNQNSLLSLIQGKDAVTSSFMFSHHITDYYAKTTDVLEALPRDMEQETDELPCV
ncbi:MAG TPA: hypothetical protein VGO47_01520 [Chlamydiales bacterium]|nr:hypothetical protein [Chlamydiales bacterium]